MKKSVLSASALAFVLAATGCVENVPVDPGGPSTTVPTDDREGRFVATDGADAGACDTPELPCATINYAVAQAAPNETVWVDAGTYPELVSVTKPLTFSGPNAGKSAGTDSVTRGAEAIVKGFRTPGSPHPTADGEYNVTIDGFTVNPQGDTTLLTPNTYNLVSLFGSTDVKVINNIIQGADAYVPNCSYTCTDMADGAIFVRSGTYVVAHNRVENFRRPVDIGQVNAVTPIVSARYENNVIRDFSFRGIWAIELGSPFGEDTVVIENNSIVGPAGANTSTGALVTAGGVTFRSNTFTNLDTGVYEQLCAATNPSDIGTNYDGNTFDGVGLGLQLHVTGDCTGRNPNANIVSNGFVTPGAEAIRVQGAGTLPTISAACNWFGSADGPGANGNATVSASVDATPWLVGANDCSGGV